MRFIEIAASGITMRHELTNSDLHNIGFYGDGKFTRENVAQWVSGGYAPFAFEIGVHGWEDFHAVFDDEEIPWTTEKGRKESPKSVAFVNKNQ